MGSANGQCFALNSVGPMSLLDGSVAEAEALRMRISQSPEAEQVACFTHICTLSTMPLLYAPTKSLVAIIGTDKMTHHNSIDLPTVFTKTRLLP